MFPGLLDMYESYESSNRAYILCNWYPLTNIFQFREAGRKDQRQEERHESTCNFLHDRHLGNKESKIVSKFWFG